jgi:hypothetical protein
VGGPGDSVSAACGALKVQLNLVHTVGTDPPSMMYSTPEMDAALGDTRNAMRKLEHKKSPRMKSGLCSTKGLQPSG